MALFLVPNAGREDTRALGPVPSSPDSDGSLTLEEGPLVRAGLLLDRARDEMDTTDVLRVGLVPEDVPPPARDNARSMGDRSLPLLPTTYPVRT